MKTQDKLVELQKVNCPIRFEFLNKDFVVEIQHFVTPVNQFRSELGDIFSIFAVTTDGWDLLIDASYSSDSILQKEPNDIDFIDVTISELIEAKHVTL